MQAILSFLFAVVVNASSAAEGVSDSGSALQPAATPPISPESGGKEASISSIFKLLEEEQMVTTGTRTAVKLSESPSSVWVIDRAMIRASGALSLQDLMRLIPGIMIYEADVGVSYVSARTFATTDYFPRILLMIDGRSVNPDAFGNTDWMSLSVDLFDLERIEVVLGPATTLYGANAYSAVVNLITVKPVEKGFRTSAVARGGVGWASTGADVNRTLGRGKPLGTAFADYSQRLGPLSLRLSANGTYVSPPGEDYVTTADPLNVPLPWRRGGGNLDLAGTVNGWKLRGQGTAAYKDSRVNAAFSSRPRTFQDASFAFHAEKPKLAGDDDMLTLMAWGRNLQIKESIDIGDGGLNSLDVSTNTWSFEVLAQYVLPRFFGNRLVIGWQSRLIDVTGETVDPMGRFQHLHGLFIEDEYRPIKQLILTAGVRLETREQQQFRAFSRLVASPRGAIVYLPHPDHSLRAEFATAYRNPAPTENFVHIFAYNRTLEIMVPNTALRPEENLMGSLSYNGRFAWLNPRLEGFYGVQRDVIQSTPVVSDVLLPLHFANRQSFTYAGASAVLRMNPVPGLQIAGMYTLLYMQDRQTKQNIEIAPKHSVGLSLTYQWRRLRASLQAYYVSGTTQVESLPPDLIFVRLNERVIINPWIGYRFGRREEWEVFASGTNIADIRFGGTKRDFLNHNDTSRIGPRVWLGLSFAWDSEAPVSQESI